MSRVLVADDDADLRALVELAVTKAGHVVVGSVGDGAAALELVRTQSPDLLVLDVTMPVMGGLEVCAHLHAAGSSVRVLLVTADPQSEVAGREAGADAFLSKPFRLRELTARVEALLGPAT